MVASSDLDLAGDVPVTQHGDAVAECQDLVELVGDEDQTAPVGGHLTEGDEELVDLLGRQHRGRLVEDQQLGVAVQRLDDLDPLPLTDGQLPDQRIRVDVEAVAVARVP